MKRLLMSLVLLLTLLTQPAQTKAPKPQIYKEGQKIEVPFDGFLIHRDGAKKLLVISKEFESCSQDREQAFQQLDSCLESKQTQWWNSTYFKITLGIFLGYTAAKIGE